MVSRVHCCVMTHFTTLGFTPHCFHKYTAHTGVELGWGSPPCVSKLQLLRSDAAMDWIEIRRNVGRQENVIYLLWVFLNHIIGHITSFFFLEEEMTRGKIGVFRFTQLATTKQIQQMQCTENTNWSEVSGNSR